MSRPSVFTKEDQFGQLLTPILKYYEAETRARKIELMPMYDWANGEWDARIKFDGIYHNLYLSGGMLRHPGMTADSAILVVTHELGHLLGQGPRMDYHNTTVEGEADYFSGKAFRALAKAGILPRKSSHQFSPFYQKAKEFLSQHVQDPQELELAIRLAVATKELLTINQELLHQFGGPVPNAEFDYDSPDPSVVNKTLESYASDQARLDTVLAGFLGKPRPRSWAHPDDYK